MTLKNSALKFKIHKALWLGLLAFGFTHCNDQELNDRILVLQEQHSKLQDEQKKANSQQDLSSFPIRHAFRTDTYIWLPKPSLNYQRSAGHKPRVAYLEPDESAMKEYTEWRSRLPKLPVRQGLQKLDKSSQLSPEDLQVLSQSFWIKKLGKKNTWSPQ